MKRLLLFLISMTLITGALFFAGSLGSAAVAEFLCSSAACRQMTLSWGIIAYTACTATLVGTLLWARWPR